MNPTLKTLRLSAEQVLTYQQNGYLVVDEVLGEREIESFLKRLNSSQPPSGLRHHTVDPDWEYICKHPRVAGIAGQLLGGRPRILQSMYLPKKPSAAPKSERAGIAMHQDLHHLPVEPADALIACWIALNDTDAENGGLCVVPASHRRGILATHKNTDTDHDSWEMEHRMRDRSGRTYKQKFYSFKIEIPANEQVALRVARGAAVFFTGLTIHGSHANNSLTRSRLAFAVHYVREGAWCFRADVQETIAVTQFSDVPRR
jgi:ectoine hydroxylase-related dioxygenase (phytanoyl-CoA dioxygenase family)